MNDAGKQVLRRVKYVAAGCAGAALRKPVLDWVLAVVIGLPMASAFPAILVYAQEPILGAPSARAASGRQRWAD